MKSSTILVYCTQHMPTGGIESHLQEFCYHLSLAGEKVDLFVLNSAMSAETELYFRRICRSVYLGKSGRSPWRLAWMFWMGLRLFARHYDTVYTNGQGKSIWIFSRMFRNRNRWVHHHHTNGDVCDQASWHRGYRKSLQVANKVIACSDLNRNNLQTVLKRDIEVVPCFSRKIGSRQTETSLVSGRFKLGYYGRLIPEKGIDILCRLSNEADFQNIEFHLWGEGESYPPCFFVKFPRIRYHGSFQGYEELKQVIHSLDGLLMLTTHAEGLPINLLEAMSAGLPWLATDRGGIPDIASDPCATRVIPASSDYVQIKEAIRLFVSDLQSGSVSKTAQIALYERKFSSSALISQWRNVLGFS